MFLRGLIYEQKDIIPSSVILVNRSLFSCSLGLSRTIVNIDSLIVDSGELKSIMSIA